MFGRYSRPTTCLQLLSELHRAAYHFKDPCIKVLRETGKVMTFYYLKYAL